MEQSQPPLTGTTHTLPFDKLSPRDYERLCLWLVEREGFKRAEHLGAAGREQGRDIIAWRGNARWAFQCKRVQHFGPRGALAEVEKVLALPGDERPEVLVFIVTCDVSATARQQARERAGEMECYFWTGTELDARVKRHPDIVAEFFQTGRGPTTVINQDVHVPVRSSEVAAQHHEVLLAEYRAHVRRTCAYLPLGGLALPEVNGCPLDPALLRIPLDRVYIKLLVLLREDCMEELSSPEDPQMVISYVRERQQRQREGEVESGRLKHYAPVSPHDAVAEHPRLVILGDPGAGKSTFLRYLAWLKAADEGQLPILVPLGRADAAMRDGRSFLDAALDLLTDHKTGTERVGLRAALEGEIATRRVYWLWDAVDEVRMHRREIVTALGGLSVDDHQMVITSRPLGYVPVPGCDVVYEVLPLAPGDAQSFVDRWFAALAEARGVPGPERKEWAADRAAWLRAQLDERPGLRAVAESPLMLTFLAILAGDEPRRDFPRHRKDLHARYVERLFTTWEARRRGDEPLLPGIADPYEAREMALWGFHRVALHLHQAYGGRPETATRAAAKRALAGQLVHQAGHGRFQAPARAEALLVFWERAGLLDLYRLGDQEWLAFRHLTFQEYGAARALAEAHWEDLAGLWAELEPHLLDGQWAEVIPLTLAHLADATLLLKRLLETDVEENDQRPLLFLAAAALAEGASAAEAVRRSVVDGLDSLARMQWSKIGVAFASTCNALMALGRLWTEPYAIQKLLLLARDRRVDPWVRMQVPHTLRRLGWIDALLALCCDDAVDKFVRTSTSRALLESARADDLLTLAQVLASFGQKTIAISALQTIADDAMMDSDVRREASSTLFDLNRVPVQGALKNIANRIGVAPSDLLPIATKLYLFVRQIKQDPDARLLVERDGEIQEIILDFI